jgi:hypothetical protein
VFGGMGLAPNRPGSLVILETTGETSITSAHYRQRFQPVSIVNRMGAYREYLKGIPEVNYNSWIATG